MPNESETDDWMAAHAGQVAAIVAAIVILYLIVSAITQGT